MYPGSASDAIRHFAGHMHVPEVTLHIGDVYLDPAFPGKVGQDHDPWVPGTIQYTPPDLGNPISIGIAVTNDTGHLIKVNVGHLSPPAVKFTLGPAPAALHDVTDFSPPAFYGAVRVTVTIEEAHLPATSAVADIGQINHLVNIDYVGVDVHSPAVAMSGASAPGLVSSMLDTVHDLLPTALDTTDTNGNILITHSLDAVAFVDAHDAAMNNAPAPAPTLLPGEYVNGVFDPNYGSAFHAIATLEQPHAPINIQGQETPGLDLVAGSNSLLNEGGILSYNPHTTLMVLGDAYQTNAIFQINILHDVDQVGFAAPQELVQIETGNNAVDNYASFHQYDLPTLSAAATAQFGWHVEVHDGNFYNVNVVAQVNVMVDGDVTYQTTDSSYYQLVTGANYQYNGMLLNSEGQPFDLVIVLGSYHGANVIAQTNVVLNDDVVKALLAAENAQGLSISTGDNTLLNEANISTYGPNSFMSLSPELAAHAQAAQGSEFDPLLASHAPGTGQLSVLFVTGDYYDVNIVSQINVLSDSNTAMQLMWTSSGQSTESISTGANQAANVAQIIDVNTLGAQYVAGQQYSDSLLLQTNIITDQAQVSAQNPNALANEVVAFLDHDAAAAIPTNIDIPGTGGAAHHDALGGMLS